MPRASEKIEIIYDAKTSSYVKKVEKAETANESFENEVKQANVTVEKQNKVLSDGAIKFAKWTAGIVGGVAGLNELTNSILTTNLNQIELKKNLDLTDSEFNDLTDSIAGTSKAYAFNKKQMTAVAALNSEYVTSIEDVSKANELVAQTATLYALKEGDVGERGAQLVTSQEALRDVILTGSTTAFEDAGISLDTYGEKLIELTGFTEDQIAAITEGTNGTFEYVEQLSKAASPQERFNALVETTAEEFDGLEESLSPAAKASLEFQRLMTNITTILKDNLIPTIQNLILVIAGAVKSFYDWVVSSGILTVILGGLKKAIDFIIPVLTTLFDLLTDIVELIAPYLIPIIQLLGLVIYTVANIIWSTIISALTSLKDALADNSSGLSQFLTLLFNLGSLIGNTIAPILFKLGVIFVQLVQALLPVIKAVVGLGSTLLRILVPILQIVISVLGVVIDTLVTFLGPILVTIANIISTILVVAINILTNVLNFLIPIVQSIANFFSKLANVIQNILAVAFTNLTGILGGVNTLFQTISNIVNKITGTFSKLASTVQNTLVKAFETLTKPLETVVNLFEKLLGFAGKVGDVIGGAISFINPFDRSMVPSSFNVNYANTNTSKPSVNRTTVFNVHQNGQLSKIDVIRMEKGLV